MNESRALHIYDEKSKIEVRKNISSVEQKYEDRRKIFNA